MKRWICLLLLAAMLIGCTASETPVVEQDSRVTDAPEVTAAPDVTKAPEETIAPEETDAPEETAAPADGFAQRVCAAWEAEGLLSDMAPYSDMDLMDLYGIDVSACKSAAGYCDAVGYTTEAVVIEADEATATEIEALLSDHLDAMRAQFRSYDPDALALVEQAVLWRDGGIVLMIVSPDAEAMRTVFLSVEP